MLVGVSLAALIGLRLPTAPSSPFRRRYRAVHLVDLTIGLRALDGVVGVELGA